MMTKYLFPLFACCLLIVACQNKPADNSQPADQQNAEPQEAPQGAVDPEPTGEPSEIDGKYTLESMEYNGQSMALYKDSEVSLVLDRGKASGKGSCNPYHSRFTVETGGQISFSELASGRMHCDGLMTQESRFFELLKNAQTYTQAAETRLVITASNGKIFLVKS